MRIRLLAGALGISLLAVVIYVTTRQNKPEVAKISPDRPVSEMTSAQKSATVMAAIPAPAAAPTETAVAAPALALEIPYADDLKEYLVIRNKVFMSETEKILRKSFLNNARMLIALGEFLRTPSSSDSESDDARDVATDLLLEAVQKEKSEVAEKALREVIEDAGVEDEKINQDARTTLAGTKAEILYHWSAMDPAKSEQMHSWLPGPVSEKIWQNVRQAQNQNVLESQAEVRK